MIFHQSDLHKSSETSPYTKIVHLVFISDKDFLRWSWFNVCLLWVLHVYKNWSHRTRLNIFYKRPFNPLRCKLWDSNTLWILTKSKDVIRIDKFYDTLLKRLKRLYKYHYSLLYTVSDKETTYWDKFYRKYITIF